MTGKIKQRCKLFAKLTDTRGNWQQPIQADCNSVYRDSNQTPALISIGYGRLVQPRILGQLQAASKAYSQTSLSDWPSLHNPDYDPSHAPDTDANAPSARTRTLMHLALTGLNKAENISTLAPHLLQAREMLAAGMEPLALLKAGPGKRVSRRT